MVKRTLESLGCAPVLEAADGIAAQAVLREHPDVALVLTDIMMPRMDGLELLRWGREAVPDAMWIVLSGLETFDSAVAAIRLGAFDFLPKSPRTEEMGVAVRNALERRQLLAERERLHRELQRKVRELRGDLRSAAPRPRAGGGDPARLAAAQPAPHGGLLHPGGLPPGAACGRRPLRRGPAGRAAPRLLPGRRHRPRGDLGDALGAVQAAAGPGGPGDGPRAAAGGGIGRGEPLDLRGARRAGAVPDGRLRPAGYLGREPHAGIRGPSARAACTRAAGKRA